MTTIIEAMGITEERDVEIKKIIAEAVKLENTVSGCLERLAGRRDLDETEKIYALFAYGQAHGVQNTVESIRVAVGTD